VQVAAALRQRVHEAANAGQVLNRDAGPGEQVQSYRDDDLLHDHQLVIEDQSVDRG
jgi:hypothetical protein